MIVEKLPGLKATWKRRRNAKASYDLHPNSQSFPLSHAIHQRASHYSHPIQRVTLLPTRRGHATRLIDTRVAIPHLAQHPPALEVRVGMRNRVHIRGRPQALVLDLLDRILVGVLEHSVARDVIALFRYVVLDFFEYARRIQARGLQQRDQIVRRECSVWTAVTGLVSIV